MRQPSRKMAATFLSILPRPRMQLHTNKLTLVLQSTPEILAWLGAMSPADRAQVSPDWIARVQAAVHADPWTHFFAIVHTASGTVVGSCGFKGPPAGDASVEIAYGIEEAHRGLGYATEAAAALIGFAFETAPIRSVRAHTLPEANASGRVLGKCGFRRVGEVVDPEDGLVWRWEILRPADRSIAASGVAVP